MKKLFSPPQIAICGTHGEFEQVSFIFRGELRHTSCPICLTLKTEKENLQKLKEQKKNDQLATIRAVVNRAAIPPAFENCTFDNYEIYAGESQQKIVNNLKAFAKRFNDAKSANVSGILIGPTGTGKTHLASAVINELIKNGFTAVFVTMSDITNRLRATFNDKNKSKEEVIQQFVDIDLLVIDEAGISPSNFDRNEIFDIINRRYSLKRPVLVTTNLLADLKNTVGDRVYSRLQQGKFVQVLNWEDYRTRHNSKGA